MIVFLVICIVVLLLVLLNQKAPLFPQIVPFVVSKDFKEVTCSWETLGFSVNHYRGEMMLKRDDHKVTVQRMAHNCGMRWISGLYLYDGASEGSKKKFIQDVLGKLGGEISYNSAAGKAIMCTIQKRNKEMQKLAKSLGFTKVATYDNSGGSEDLGVWMLNIRNVTKN